MVKNAFLSLLILACPLALPAAGFGSVAALLMAEGLAVQPLGQGGAWTARAQGGASLQVNPAGLAAQDGLSLGGGQVLGLEDDRLTWLDAAAGLGHGLALGVQAAYQSGQDTARDAFGNDLGTFSDTEALGGLALGLDLGSGWHAGVGIKGLSENNGGQVDSSAAGDLGLQGPLGSADSGRSFGLAVLNAGSSLPGNGASGLPIPLRIQAGVATPLLVRRWQLEADAQDLPQEGQARLMLGSELGFDVPGDGGYHGALRLGGQWGVLISEDPVLSLGAGLSSGADWDLDYALQSLGALGLAHRFSLTLRFLGAGAAPAASASAAPAGGLTAPYALHALRQIDGLLLTWEDDNAAVKGFNLYSDYGVLVERLNPAPVEGKHQKFIQVTPSRTYNFYVRAVGPDGKEGPPSEVLMWLER
jgi:hypothetical protein